MTKIPDTKIKAYINTLLTEKKDRKFVESIELQIGLKVSATHNNSQPYCYLPFLPISIIIPQTINTILPTPYYNHTIILSYYYTPPSPTTPGLRPQQRQEICRFSQTTQRPQTQAQDLLHRRRSPYRQVQSPRNRIHRRRLPQAQDQPRRQEGQGPEEVGQEVQDVVRLRNPAEAPTQAGRTHVHQVGLVP